MKNTNNFEVKFFMYHDIRDSIEYKNRYNLKPFLTIKEFETQLDYICSLYTVISTQEYLELDKKEGKFAVLTFDDGLLDHYNVSKLLKIRGLTGTFLIPTKPIISDYVMCSHKIQFVLSEIDELVIVKKIIELLPEPSDELWEKYSISEFKNNWWTPEMIFITNISRQHKDGMEVTDKLFEMYITKDLKSFNDMLYLNEYHIEEMIKDGMEIGCHGYISENCLFMDNDIMKRDIEMSCNYIKKYLTKNKPLIFSYPNGGYNKDVVNELSKNGCVIAYTTKPQNSLDNNLTLPRVSAPEELPR
tara:strand:+ start:4732 stop:5637 length:906 start_codon:yes stop_codon:yes gene_type:complete